MAERRKNCWQCKRYDREARHCRDGKANPKSNRDSKEVAEALGVQALCLYNLYRDAFALRMYFPDRLLLHPPTEKRSRRNNRMQNDADPANPEIPAVTEET